MVGWMDVSKHVNDWLDGWMDEWMDDWLVGWMSGLMSGWVGERVENGYKLTDRCMSRDG